MLQLLLKLWSHSIPTFNIYVTNKNAFLSFKKFWEKNWLLQDKNKKSCKIGVLSANQRQKLPPSRHVTGVRWVRAEWELRRAGWTTLGLSNPLVRWRLPWARDHVNIEQLQWWAARWSSSHSLTYLHGLNKNTITQKEENRAASYTLFSVIAQVEAVLITPLNAGASIYCYSWIIINMIMISFLGGEVRISKATSWIFLSCEERLPQIGLSLCLSLSPSCVFGSDLSD